MSTIYGSATGANVIYGKNNTGVAFSENGEIPCTENVIVGETNTGTQCLGVGTALNSVTVAKTSATVAENDKIEKIGVKIGTEFYQQPSTVKLVAYTNTSNLPDKFICMTESFYLDDYAGYLDLDVVNASGSVEAHTITASEAGYIWLGNWCDRVQELCFNLIGAGLIGWNSATQTFNSSNTVEPLDPFGTMSSTYPWQLRGRLTCCVVE